jgi:hypothetical protein
MDAEEIENNLDPLYEAAMKEQRDIADCIEQLTKSAKDFIGKRYTAEVNNLSADGYRKLEDIISMESTSLAIKISNLMYHYKEE